ncbi:ribonuclease HI [uncultured Sphingomonas sp.]|uniref:ribonuclease HI n=1 Tax=uncultured Sphingomonas sp. TaxID=158754 RepID=UPI0035CBA43A
MPSRLKVFFDGGCRPNPGRMEIAVVMGGRTELFRDVGHGTSMDAEWLALIHALTVARSFGRADYVLLGDSANVVAQASGTAKCRGDAVRHLETFRAMTAAVGPPTIRYVKRSQNLAGIALTTRFYA